MEIQRFFFFSLSETRHSTRIQKMLYNFLRNENEITIFVK